MEELKNESNSTIIECDCGSHLLKVQSEVDYYNEGFFNQDIYLAMYEHGKPKTSFWDRIKLCWQVLRKGDPYADQIVLSPKEARKLSDFIVSNLKEY